ncbi:MAG: hypothetical protein ACXV9P_06485 [Acidimicrobiia bacterium]
MSNTPHFAFNVASCAVLVIMFWAACAGIGYRILPPARAPRLDPDVPDQEHEDAAPASWRQPGVAACVGLGALLLLGGFGVLLRIPWWLIVVPFIVIGLVLALRDLSTVGITRLPRSVLIIGALGVVAFGLVALVESPLGLRLPLNVCDDWRAYMPYAHRLLDTYGLDETWSIRRVQTLGGFDLLRALPVQVFGDAGIGVAETVIGSVFLAGLFVANGVRSTWARLVSVGLIIAVPLLWVPRTNTTGVLIGSPLLVAVFAATVELRGALRVGNRRAAFHWAVAGGLVVAALMSVRPNLGLLGAVVLTLGALSASGSRVLARIQVLLAGGGAALLAFAPWSIAMWRTAGTPLYPLFPGNLSEAALERPALHGIRDVAQHAFDLTAAGPYLWVTLGVLVVSVVVRKLLPDATLVVIAALATAAVSYLFAFNTPTASWVTTIRYFAPMSEGLAVFFVCEMIRGADARPKRERAGSFNRAVPILGVASALVLFAFAYSTAGLEYTPFRGGAHIVELAAKDQLKPSPDKEVTTPALRTQYRRAFLGVNPHRTIVAVDRPYLIDYSRYDVQNLDAPGYMTPDGSEFPFFTGPVPKIAYLRDAGYDTLIATDPTVDACLNSVRIGSAVLTRPDLGDAYRRFLDWDGDVQSIAKDAPAAVRRYGDLLVIDLPKAQRELAAEKGS